MLSLVTVSPVITAFHSCCLSHYVFDQADLGRNWNRYLLTMLTGNRRDSTPLSAAPSEPVAQRIEALSLYEKNNKNYQRSAIKLILRLRSFVSKRIPNKDKNRSLLVTKHFSRKHHEMFHNAALTSYDNIRIKLVNSFSVMKIYLLP